MRLGVLGGTFDPPHCGHLILAEQAREQFSLDCVLWVPAADPPHKQGRPITPVRHRLEMLSLAIADNPAFELSLVDVSRPGPHYTADMLALIQEERQPAHLYFMVGGDSLRDLTTWHEPARIVRQATLVVMARPDAQVNLDELGRRVPGLIQSVEWLEAPLIDISGTDIRERASVGRTIRYLVPRPVELYIHQHTLYQD